MSSYLLPSLLALLVHAVAVVLLSGVWSTPEERVVNKPKHVQATIIDLKSLPSSQRKEAEARAKADAQKKREENERKQAAAEKKRQQEAVKEQARKDAEKKRKAQEQAKKLAADKKAKADAAKKAADAEKKKQAAEKAAREKALKDKAAKEKAAKDKAARAKAAKEQAAKDKAAREQALKEQAAKEQAAKEKAAREKAAQEQAQRESAAAQQEALRQQIMREAMAEEEAEFAAQEQEQAALGYVDLIRQTIEDFWRLPRSARNGMEVEVVIYLLPSGEVLDVSVVRASGDVYFDRSAVDAVKRARSFPELQDLDPIAFDRYYRELNMIFRPEDLRN